MQLAHLSFFVLILGIMSLWFNQLQALLSIKLFVFSFVLFLGSFILLFLETPLQKFKIYMAWAFIPQKKGQYFSEAESKNNQLVLQNHIKISQYLGFISAVFILLFSTNFKKEEFGFYWTLFQEISSYALVYVLFRLFIIRPLEIHLKFPEKLLSIEEQNSLFWHYIPFSPVISFLFLLLTTASPMFNGWVQTKPIKTQGSMEFYSEIANSNEPLIFPFKTIKIETQNLRLNIKFHANLGKNHAEELEAQLLKKEDQIISRLQAFLRAAPESFFLQLEVKKRIEEKFMDYANEYLDSDYHLKSVFISDFMIEKNAPTENEKASSATEVLGHPTRNISSQPEK